ncbi:AraC family transcriptional regulator [Noviherbaspirillum saxi]|uniref:AraC family transcriptional regulator n=1 Tax=Noviherbaspirillum saxi TaxID=2320863 RepID=A0A3A3FXZ9_9BURK|nr:AraC family transcriptional regulator [Noviherbaspirillum saxi]RJF91949.1 AraC family transcriptional regulator [Noviherbaspirillum saxi]
MIENPHQVSATVSAHFLHAMLRPVRQVRNHAAVMGILSEARIAPELLDRPGARITREQFVLLYKRIAFELDDEMLGLWSRPVRGGTLKYLCLSLLDAPTILIALNRFLRFWNLILDDYRLHMSRQNGLVRISLAPRHPAVPVTMLGHELMMKLIHGIVSWLLAKEIAIERVEFAFDRPAHAADYIFLYPGEVTYSARESCVWLADAYCQMSFKREKHQLWAFLKRAPEDWAFTMFNRGSISARTREYLETRLDQAVDIQHVADAFHLSVRTLTRKFTDEGVTFQSVKDALRRDVAVQRLSKSTTSIAAIAMDLGYANAAAFCRAFKQWTGSTPTAYRRGDDRHEVS